MLLGQLLIGRKKWAQVNVHNSTIGTSPATVSTQREFVAKLLDRAPDAPVITGDGDGS